MSNLTKKDVKHVCSIEVRSAEEEHTCGVKCIPMLYVSDVLKAREALKERLYKYAERWKMEHDEGIRIAVQMIDEYFLGGEQK